MKVLAKDAVEILRKIDGDASIFFWYKTIEDFPETLVKVWNELDDDSYSLDETIDEYISVWIEET